jgi:hypothetical protein
MYGVQIKPECFWLWTRHSGGLPSSRFHEKRYATLARQEGSDGDATEGQGLIV